MRWLRRSSTKAGFAAFAGVLVIVPGAVRAADPLKLGLAAPLSGPDSGFGLGLRAGVEQAVAEINRAGGVEGRRIALTVFDDSGEAKQGIAVARQFAAAGITLVIGHLHASVAAATLPIYDEAGILAISPGATYPPLSRRNAWNFFRLSGNDAQQGQIAGTYLADQFRDRPVAILNDKTAFGRALADEAARALKTRGGREVLFEGVSRDDREVAGLVAKLRALGIEAVYFGGLQAPAALLVKAMREAGLTTTLIGSDGLLDKDFLQGAGPAAEGTVMTLAPNPPRLPDVRGAARTPRPPEAEMFAGPAYAAIEVIRQGAEAARSTEPAKVAAHLHGGAPLRTLIGEVAFDSRGDLARPPFAVATWRKLADGRIDYAGTETAP